MCGAYLNQQKYFFAVSYSPPAVGERTGTCTVSGNIPEIKSVHDRIHVYRAVKNSEYTLRTHPINFTERIIGYFYLLC